MRTIELKRDITPEEFETVRKLLQAVNIGVKKSKPEKKSKRLSEEDFYKKIDKALAQKPIKMDFEELRATLRI